MSIIISVLGCLLVLQFLAIDPIRFPLEKIRTDSVFSQLSGPTIASEIKDDILIAQVPVDVVMAKTKAQDTSWLPQNFPDWGHKIYIVDDNSTTLKVPSNKGHESMVYLT